MNDLVDDDFVLSKDSFLTVEMPNADGFLVDDRDEVELPEFTQAPCMENCKDVVPEITRHASVLDVTPETPDDGAEAHRRCSEVAVTAEAARPVPRRPFSISWRPQA